MQRVASPAKHTLADLADTLYRCADCSYCVDAVWEERGLEHVCPTLSHHSPALSYSGRGYMSIARALYEGEEFPLEDVAERVYTCTACGNCARVCPIGLSPSEVNITLRETLAAQGAVPMATQTYATELFENSGRNKDSRMATFGELQPEKTLDVSSALFLPGCEAPENTPGEVAACFSIIKDVLKNPTFIEVSVGEPAACCGSKLAALGLSGQASATCDKLKAQTQVFPHLEQIIHHSAKCAARFADDPRHTDFVRWLVRGLDEKLVNFEPLGSPAPMVCVSTCADTRDVANLFAHLAIKPRNADFTSRFAMCCGAGGGMPQIAPESASRMALAKFADMAGALDDDTVLVVPDSNCLTHLQNNAGLDAAFANKHLCGLGEYLHQHFKFSGTG